MKPYADSSFIVSLYLQDAHTPTAFAWWKKLDGQPLPWNPLHRLEVRNILRKLPGVSNRPQRVSEQQAAEALRALEFDLAAGDYTTTNLAWLNVLREAEFLSTKHALKTQCRAMDLWHCAAALDNGCDLLLSFDETQRRLAEAAGLTVWRP
jgi:predicted nucleic acid-binding protein